MRGISAALDRPDVRRTKLPVIPDKRRSRADPESIMERRAL
jgi:hypothetical protein